MVEQGGRRPYGGKFATQAKNLQGIAVGVSVRRDRRGEHMARQAADADTIIRIIDRSSRGRLRARLDQHQRCDRCSHFWAALRIRLGLKLCASCFAASYRQEAS
jgi:hypothetical protein